MRVLDRLGFPHYSLGAVWPPFWVELRGRAYKCVRPEVFGADGGTLDWSYAAAFIGGAAWPVKNAPIGRTRLGYTTIRLEPRGHPSGWICVAELTSVCGPGAVLVGAPLTGVMWPPSLSINRFY